MRASECCGANGSARRDAAFDGRPPAPGRRLTCRRVLGLVLGFACAIPASAQAPVAGGVFRDCADCPQMVVVPSGNFFMGSPDAEHGHHKAESPRHGVVIGHNLAFGRYAVTRGQYARFVAESGHAAANARNCFYLNLQQGRWVNDEPARDWRSPGFAQGDDHPVVCVSWEDAKAYAAWLGRRTGQRYRLASEAEWEYAARGGLSAPRPQGAKSSKACLPGNAGDGSRDRALRLGSNRHWTDTHNCDDGFAYTSPVGSFAANAFGLYDVIGNVWEWTEDCWNDTYAGAPADGSARHTGDCQRRVIRGGSWGSAPDHARFAARFPNAAGSREDHVGFRIVREF